MIIADDFVYVHMPKTGGTFVTHALKQVHKAHGHKYGRISDIEPKHGTCHDIPAEHRHKTIVSTIRNPFDWYVSQFEFSWWKRTFEYFPEKFPTPVGAAIERALPAFQERHKHFPELSFSEFLDLCMESADIYNADLGTDIGLYSHGLLRFYCRDPAAVTRHRLEAGSEHDRRPAMFDVHFLATDKVSDQLYGYLVDRGYEADDVEFIRTLGRILPMGRGRQEGQVWDDYYDDDLMALIRKKDSVGFGIYEAATSLSVQRQGA